MAVEPEAGAATVGTVLETNIGYVRLRSMQMHLGRDPLVQEEHVQLFDIRNICKLNNDIVFTQSNKDNRKNLR